MQFLQLSMDDPRCVGAVLAHATAAGTGARLAKGTKLTADAVATLRQSGVSTVTLALLDADDLDEDVAATCLAARFLAGCDHITAHQAATGRVNLFAKSAGILSLHVDAIDAFNGVDPSITVATLPAFARVDAKQMVATVKIIPFAVPAQRVEAAQAMIAPDSFRVAPFKAGRRCLLIQTELPSVKPSVLDKTAALTGARLAGIGCDMVDQKRCAHDTAALAPLLAAHGGDVDLIVVFGASAVADVADVVPAAIDAAGGQVLRVGMPVDPGNLLVLGQLRETVIIGAPGCARSPKRNGFDWIIERWAADLPIDRAVVSAMGVGGLLAEIEDRPRPRAKR